MKTFMLIIILIGVCWGQNKYLSLDITFVRVDTTSYNFIFLEHLLEYEKECHADSTFLLNPIPCPDNLPGCLVYHATKFWIHREPTFKGFIEFIKRKLK